MFSFGLKAFAIFIFSVSNDWMSVEWHEAREKNRPIKGAIVALLLGLIGWLSIIWVVADSYWLMLPDLLGNIVGSYFGIKHYHGPLPIAVALGLSKKPEKSNEES